MSVRSAIGGIVGGVVGFFVGGPAGAAWGFAIGAGIGAYTETTNIPGPKLADATVQTSSVGGTITFGSGGFPSSGNVIWIGPLKTTKKKQKGGGKGGGGTSTDVYSYSRSYAIAVSEQVDSFLIIKRNGKIVYSNDPSSTAEDVAYSRTFMQKCVLYTGSESQMPDPTISAVEGNGNVSPFRGIAYIVVKDDDLTDMLGAIPQYEFVLKKVNRADNDSVTNALRGVTLIPSTGEGAYGTTYAYTATARGNTAAHNNQTLRGFLNLNKHSNNGKVDIVNAIEDLDANFPNCNTVALVVSWFADDLRAGVCNIKPGFGLSSAYKFWWPTLDFQWQVQGFKHDSSAQYVHFITGRESSNAAYGSTPSDWSILEAIAYLKSKGKRIIFYPFVLVDIPPGNTLPDPASSGPQPVNPWRGRITCYPAPGRPGSPDGTSAAASQINTFFTREMGFSRMIYHYINICKQAGGVDVFLIGSEMVGITKVRSSRTESAAVPHLKTLAAAASTIPNCLVSYAADWTEYKGFQYGNDLIFSLDPLWSDANIDFIGIDNYFPIADVRAEDNKNKIYDIEYLKSQIEGGELWDWYYLDRTNNIRAPIADGAYNKPWVYRQKDFRSFWANSHINRLDGVETGTATSWVPQSKPVWFTEFGCAAINRGPNQPNVFFDPNSSESSFPYFSTGARDDNAQYSYLKATLEYWRDNGGAMLSTANMVAWTWDVRPYPAFPNQILTYYAGNVSYTRPTWGDYVNYPRGHWLMGRFNNSSLGQEISSVLKRLDIPENNADLIQLRSLPLNGYRIASETNAVTIIQSFQMAYFFDVGEWDRQLHFIVRGQPEVVEIPYEDLLPSDDEDEEALEVVRVQEIELLRKLSLTAFDPTIGYTTNTQTAERRIATISAKAESSQQLPLSFNPDELATIANKRIKIAWGESETFKFRTTMKYSYLTETDVVVLPDKRGNRFRARIMKVSEDSLIRSFEATLDADWIYETESTGLSTLPPEQTAPGEIGVTTIYPVDLSPQKDQDDEYGVYAAIVGGGAGWNGAQIDISTDGGATVLQTLNVVTDSTIGNLTSKLLPEFSSEYPSQQTVSVFFEQTPESITRAQQLSYMNKLAVQLDDGSYEVLQYQTATANDDGSFTLSNLVRGRYATTPGLASEGALVVVIDEFLPFVQFQQWVINSSLSYRATSVGSNPDDSDWITIAAPRKSQTEWKPTFLRSTRDASNTVALTLVGRGRLGVETAPRNSKYFAGYRFKFSDGFIIDSAEPSATRANTPAGAGVSACALNSISGEGPYTAVIGT
ncbi:hypothetical protein [Xanthomonas phage XAJ2]|uniref:Uncharacterized protein n=1 Tax=Xanthomonas phage XAJ2 TaxID=1775249 RepID=A0A1I9L2F3_9CAUD|nr:hypothetical protein [Xanthomonas phage XAJ2]